MNDDLLVIVFILISGIWKGNEWVKLLEALKILILVGIIVVFVDGLSNLMMTKRFPKEE